MTQKKGKGNQIMRDEIEKKFQLKMDKKKKQKTIKRIRIRLDIKIKCKRIRLKRKSINNSRPNILQ